MGKVPEPAAFVAKLAPALRQAASIARALEGRVANRPKHGESSDIKAALTIADTAAQEAILVPLREHFAEVQLSAEEDTPSVAHFPERADARVVIDPIDGTLRFYLEAGGPYAIIVGLAIEGEYQASLVALPREGLFLDAVRGAGARLSRDEGEPEAARSVRDGNGVLVSHDLPESAVASLQKSGFEVRPASGGAISVAPLIPGVCGGVRLMQGDPGNVSIRGRVGALIASEAGAHVVSESGDPFPNGIDEPRRAMIVAAEASMLEPLLSALEAAGVH